MLRYTCCGVRIDSAGLTESAERILDASANGTPCSVYLCNAYNLALASRDCDYRSALNKGDLNLGDGWPVRAISRLRFFKPISEAPIGSDLVVRICQEGQQLGTTHGFIGSNQTVLTDLAARLRATLGSELRITVLDPLVNSDSIDTLVDRAYEALRTDPPDVVWVGLGTPKQDYFVEALQRRLPGIYIAVGAAFDFLSGHKRRAPRAVRYLGLEWLHRLLTEPRRLWRRYLLGNSRFLYALLHTPPRRLTEDLRISPCTHESRSFPQRHSWGR
jgi:N-acetylglucosaminyldiphosphoundecaprenol N-acetyl-beta-D-mannosaminyltransferase